MNPVVHFELPYENPDRAATFYESAFGWKPNMLGEAMGNYITMQTTETDENRMVKTPGTINGGMYKKPEDPIAGHPSVVISVPDIAAALEKIRAAGGTVHNEPMDIPGIGKFSSFSDTEGNRLSVLQPLMQ